MHFLKKTASLLSTGLQRASCAPRYRGPSLPPGQLSGAFHAAARRDHRCDGSPGSVFFLVLVVVVVTVSNQTVVWQVRCECRQEKRLGRTSPTTRTAPSPSSTSPLRGACMRWTSNMKGTTFQVGPHCNRQIWDGFFVRGLFCECVFFFYHQQEVLCSSLWMQ